MEMPSAPGGFQTTRWSVVRALSSPDDAVARAALDSLCATYWYPLYAYFRRCGRSAADAEDLTQGLFARLVRRDAFGAADPGRGRLRTFLLACARNFLTDAHRRERPAGVADLPALDPMDAEARYGREPVDSDSPDRIFQRRWAMALLDKALAALRDEYAAAGEAALFDDLRPFLGFGPEPDRRYEDLAAERGDPVGTLKNRVFRLRQRWRTLLFEAVGETLEDPTPERIRDELSELLGAV